jgi:biopolymer transport protein ExbD
MGTICRLQGVLQELDLIKMNYFTAGGEGLPLMLPSPDIEKRIEDIPPDNFAVLVIGADESVTLLGEGQIERGEIAATIEKRLLGMPALIVWIRTTDDARYGDFVRVLEEVKKAGAMRILVNTDGARPGDI